MLIRYQEHQGFGPHYDEVDVDPATGHASHLTLLIYLSGLPSNGGGETVFYKGKGKGLNEVVSVRPEPGLALLHEQGARCLLHEGRPVTHKRGDKWVLRSDVLVAA